MLSRVTKPVVIEITRISQWRSYWRNLEHMQATQDDMRTLSRNRQQRQLLLALTLASRSHQCLMKLNIQPQQPAAPSQTITAATRCKFHFVAIPLRVLLSVRIHSTKFYFQCGRSAFSLTLTLTPNRIGLLVPKCPCGSMAYSG